ncbi:MAG: hypothetical protein ABFE07_28555 [Armatimonadia bacterium]
MGQIKRIAATGRSVILELTVPTVLYRGVAFNVVIQAKKANGDLATGYVPATGVDITIDSSDASDVVAPTSTDTTGWALGAKTVACTVTGGSGGADFTLSATDQDRPAVTGDSAERHITTPFETWSSDGTLTGNVVDLVYESVAAEFYALDSGGKLYRRDGANDWTNVATLPAGSAPAKRHVLAAFNGSIFAVWTVGGVRRVYRLDGASFTLELSSYNTNGDSLWVKNNKLYWDAIDTSPGTKYGAKRDAAGVWAWGALPSQLGAGAAYYGVADFEFAGVRPYSRGVGITNYLEGADNLTITAGTDRGTNYFYQAGLYDAKLWMYNSAADVCYYTGKDSTITTVAVPAGYIVNSPTLTGANGKIYTILKRNADNQRLAYSYDGSWHEESDLGTNANATVLPMYMAGPAALYVGYNTAIHRLGDAET